MRIWWALVINELSLYRAQRGLALAFVLTLFIRPEQPGISKKVSRYDGKCAADIAA